MKQLIALYFDTFGTQPASIEPLAQAGSNRQYFRLSSPSDRPCIGVVGNNVRENRSFVYLARHFASKGLPVPQILNVAADESTYLQTDLGDCSLHDVLTHSRQSGVWGEAGVALLKKTMRLLPRIQVLGAEGLEENQLLPPTRFDLRSAMFDLNYFKYCFLKTTDMPFDEVALEDDFERMAADLVACGEERRTFLYRDFQARNVMIEEFEPKLIDFQGGRIGPLHYDVASFLWQASAAYPTDLRERLIDEYLDALTTILPEANREKFRSELRLFVFFRTLQVLGAYGLRGYFEQKPYFLNSIPAAISNLRELLREDVADAYPALRNTLDGLVALSQFQTQS